MANYSQTTIRMNLIDGMQIAEGVYDNWLIVLYCDCPQKIPCPLLGILGTSVGQPTKTWHNWTYLCSWNCNKLKSTPKPYPSEPTSSHTLWNCHSLSKSQIEFICITRLRINHPEVPSKAIILTVILPYP